jgi:RHS repeat-associated protein
MGSDQRIIDSDQVGSVRLVVNVADTSDVLFRAEYTAFGEMTVLDGDVEATPFGFAGGLFDADTRLTRFGARDYDPHVGRWTSKDPILWGGGQVNIYEYVGGNPVHWIDPGGLSKFDKICGLPKRFMNWLHRQDKKNMPGDYTPDELREMHKEWERLGKPGPDNKRGGTRRRDPETGGGWDEIYDWLIPIPWWPNPCVIAPWVCGEEA